MGDWLTQTGTWLSSGSGLLLRNTLDISLVLILFYVILVLIGERRTLWMVRGFIVLMLAAAISSRLNLTLLNFVLNNLVIGSAVAMAVLLQSEFRRFLEQLGRGEVTALFRPGARSQPRAGGVAEEIIEAVKELSQNRTGALIVIETGSNLDERDFLNPGVRMNAEVSSELLQSIFQTSTQLHDGAVLISENRVVSAGVILPLSEQVVSRRLGTRHRAALGITERLSQCICIVVSEETGSISLAEQGILNRPLTSSKLKALLEERMSLAAQREVIAPDLRSLSRHLYRSSRSVLRRLNLLGSRRGRP